MVAKLYRWHLGIAIALSFLGWDALFSSTIAQISEANDGVGTTVTLSGNRFDIDGGTVSKDRQNLFHSFQEFGLDAGQIANFLANPDTQNILGRVVGGEASFINGLLRVSGGDANLFLMNPAGMIFGQEARLDISGSFTATTATGIGFEDGWFNAIGSSNFENLVGAPTSFAFSTVQPGALINAGELRVLEGESVTLLGGSVVNTGAISAPEGQITVTAVPGRNSVRIGQEGMLLSLEVDILEQGASDGAIDIPFTPDTLPRLLLGGDYGDGLGLVVNANGSIQVGHSTVDTPDKSPSNIPIDHGTAIASGSINVSGDEGGAIHLLGDRVGLFNATLDASGLNGGGAIAVGGGYRGEANLPNASQTFMDSDSSINASALINGDGGQIILWAEEATEFYGEAIATGGSNRGDGGFVEVSGKEILVFRGDVDLSSANGATGTLLIDPVDITIKDGTGDGDDADADVDEPSSTFFGSPSGVSGQVAQDDTMPETLFESELEGLSADADIQLEATNDITIDDLSDNILTLASTGDVSFTADADGDGFGAFSMAEGDTISVLEAESLIISGSSIDISGINAGIDASIDIVGRSLVEVGEVIVGDGTSINFIGDEIDLVGGDNSVRRNDEGFSITESISFQPTTPSLPINVGGVGDTGQALDITARDIRAVQQQSGDSFLPFTIGNNSTNTIRLETQADQGSLTTEINLQMTSGLVELGDEFDGIATLQSTQDTITLAGEFQVESLTLNADEIDIDTTNSEISVDQLTFKTDTNTQNIQIGGELNIGDTLNITATEFGVFRPLNDSFSSLTVDSETGRLTIGAILGPVRAQQLTLSGNGVNILAVPGSFVTDKLTIQTNSPDQDLSLNAPSLAVFQPLDDSGSFVTLDFSIRDSRRISTAPSGVLTIQAPIPPTRDAVTLTGGDINLSGSVNDVKDLTLTANNDISVSSGAINSVESLTLTANNDISVSSGAINSVESLTLTANNAINISATPTSSITTVNLQADNITISGGLGTISNLLTLAANELTIESGSESIITDQVTIQTRNSGQNLLVGEAKVNQLDTLELSPNELQAFTPQNGPSFETLTFSVGGTVTVESPLPASNAINFTGNEFDLLAGKGSIDAESVSFQASGGDRNIIVGGSADTGDTVIDLTANDLDAITFSDQDASTNNPTLIVRAEGTGNISILEPFEQNLALDFETNEGSIVVEEDLNNLPSINFTAIAGGVRVQDISNSGEVKLETGGRSNSESGGFVTTTSFTDISGRGGNISAGQITGANTVTLDVISGEGLIDIGSIQSGGDIDLLTAQGNIRAGQITDVETVTLNVEAGAGAIEIDRIRAQESINLSTAGGDIAVTTRLRTPGSVGINISDGLGAVNVNQIPKAASVDIETNDGSVTVPSAIDRVDAIDITTNQGNIDLTDVSNANSVTLGTNGGSIIANELIEVGTASLSVGEGSGTVDVRRIRSTGDISLQTNQGDITVMSRIRTPGTVDIESGAGNVDVNRIQNASVVAIDTEEGAIATGTIRNAEDVTLTSNQGTIDTDTISDAEDVTLTSNQGAIVIGEIDTSRTGSVTLSAGDTITVENDIKKAETVTVQGSEIDFLGGRNSIGRSGTDITIRATQDVEIGRTSNPDIFNLDNQDTNALNSNISKIRFVALNGSDIEILAQDKPLSFDVPVVFRANNGDIRLNRAIEFEDRATFSATSNSGRILVGADLTFRGDSIWNTRARITDDVTIRSDNRLTFNDDIIGNNNSELRIISPNGLNAERIKIDGDLRLTSRRGDISTGNLRTSGDGSIDVLSRDNLSTGNINAMNDITLESRSGSIETRNLSSDGTNVQLTTPSTLSIREIDTEGANVTLTAGSIPSLGDLSTAGGNISIEVTSAAALDLATLDTSQSDLDTTTSRRGLRNTDDADSDGNVEVTTRGALTVDVIATEGGQITLDSQTSIQATQLDSSSEGGSGGAIALNAPIVNVEAIDSSGATNGGSVNIPQEGELRTIQTGTINSSGGANGGSVRMASTEILQTDAIDASAETGTGGSVSLELLVGDLDITELEDLTGSFQVASIDTRSTGGDGGNITVDTNILFRTTDIIDGTTSSINATGNDDSGSIQIDHGGGPQDITFDVLAPSTPLTDLTNGTVGSIISGSDQITPPENIAGSVTIGNVRVGTLPSTNICPPNCLPPSQDIPEPTSELISSIEERFTQEYVDYFGLDDVPIKSLKDAKEELQVIEAETGVRTALIYAFFIPPETVDKSLVNEDTEWYSFCSQLSLEGAAVDQIPGLGRGNTSCKRPDSSDLNEVDVNASYNSEGVMPDSANIPMFGNDEQKEKFRLQIVMVTPDKETSPFIHLSPVPYSFIQDDIIAPIWKELDSSSSPLEQDDRDFRLTGARLFCTLLGDLATDLNPLDIDNLAFILGEELRTLPLSAMYIPSSCDGIIPSQEIIGNEEIDDEMKEKSNAELVDPHEQVATGPGYIINEFSVAVLPSLSLVDAAYTPLPKTRTQLLAMGADFNESAREVAQWDDATSGGALNAVKPELALITEIWQTDDTVENQSLLFNTNFTQDKIREQIASLDPEIPSIVHIATHSSFKGRNSSDSYIELWKDRLLIDEIPTVVEGSNNLELLVLSSCETAKDSRDAELGFVGLAVQSGVKSGLASLRPVNDGSTFALMVAFYTALDVLYVEPDGDASTSTRGKLRIKAEALRKAQLAMLRNEIRFESGELILDSGGILGLSTEHRYSLSNQFSDSNLLNSLDDLDLSQPHRWSMFTIISSPW
ncbi:MAG: CHAT domain-containing protein [Cyanobacteria bacterium P01_F01_bin.150]